MSDAISHYRKKLAEKGIGKIIAGRLSWYKQSFQMNNWWIGRLVEVFGNKITIDGVTLSVDNPQILTMHKSSLYFGIYESGEREMAKRYIDPALPLIEIGGSIGGVSCITNRLLNDPTRHVVVECNPDNIPTLTRNRDINHCKFSIEPYALAYEPTISFNIIEGGWMTGNVAGRSEGRQIAVKTITLKQILDKYNLQTICMISDSEGAETEMVEKEGQLLARHVKRMMLETHPELRGEQSVMKTLNALQRLGFEITERDNTKDVYALSNRHLADK